MKKSLAITCFFLSGFAGLVYEIAWIKKASLVFGSTTWALSTVLGVFFGGLALGSWLFGRIAGRLDRPIRLYAFLEIALAALALLSPWAFALIDGIYGNFYRNALHQFTDPEGLTWLSAGGGLVFIRIALVALVLLPPTILMGGTLPLFCRQFVVARDRMAGSIGFLYGVNTFGAALGTVAAGFFLIPRVGVTGAIAFAAGLNILVGITALSLRFRPAGEIVPPAKSRTEKAVQSDLAAADPGRPALILIPALFFMTGLVAIGAEILWARFLSLMIRNSVHTYTITLSIVLMGIVLGSVLAGRLGDRRLPLGLGPGTLFASFQIGSALAILVLMFLPTEFWSSLGQGLGPYFLLMLPPAVLSGASFPLANRMVLDRPQVSAQVVGRMTALNTLGGICGSALAGFYLLPVLGLAAGVKIITLLGLLAGVMALLTLDPSRTKARTLRLVVAGLAVAVWIGTPLASRTRLPLDYLDLAGPTLDHAEGLGSTLSAVQAEGVVNLQIDNLWQGTNVKGHQIMAAHVPAILHPAPHRVLVIGVGVGQTAGRFLYHGIDALDCVDIEPDIFPFIARNFDSRWMADPRVQLIPDDGRTFLAHGGLHYDIISVEVGQLFRPGVDSFYTREFYLDVAEHLEPGGLVAQFVSLSFFAEAEFKSVLATFLEVFPQAVLWYNTQELLLVGSQDRQPVFDPGRLAYLEPTSSLRQDLTWSHWGGATHHLDQPGAFLGGFLADSEALAAMSSGGVVFSDDLPRLAYATAGVQIEDHLEKPLAQLLAKHLSPLDRALGSGAWEHLLDLARSTRRLNLRDILATGLIADATRSQHELGPSGTIPILQRALDLNPESHLARSNIGKAHLLAGQLDRAESYLQEAVVARPELGVPRRDLGLVLLRTNRPDEALVHLELAARVLPRDFAVHNYLGTAYAITGDVERAIAEFEKALELSPEDESVKQNLARARQGR